MAPIRPLTADDAQAYHALRVYALGESPMSFGSSVEEEAPRPLAEVAAFLQPRWGAVAGEAERVVFGAFVEGQLVGLTAVGREPALKEWHKGFIRSVYVRPEHRGRGLAAALLRQALQQADAWPRLTHVRLVANAHNPAALALYRRAGFQVFGHEPQAIAYQGVFHDELHLLRVKPAG